MEFVTSVTNGICVKYFWALGKMFNNQPENKTFKIRNQCKAAALSLLGHHAKNKKHSGNIPDQKLTLSSDL